MRKLFSCSTIGNKLNCTASSVQKLLPAIQALTRDTQVPVSIALSTRDETSLLLDGQIEALIKENSLCQRLSLREKQDLFFVVEILTQASNHNAQ